MSDAPDKGVRRMEQEGGPSRDEGRSRQSREDHALGSIDPSIRPGEPGADDAFLDPEGALLQDPVGGKTGQLGAGARAAGGTVIGLAGTQDEVP